MLNDSQDYNELKKAIYDFLITLCKYCVDYNILVVVF